MSCLKKSTPGAMFLAEPPLLTRRGPDRGQRRVGRQRAAVEGDVVVVLGLLQLRPRGRARRRSEQVQVAAERDESAVVLVVAAVRGLLVLRDVLPGHDLVGREQVLAGAGGRERADRRRRRPVRDRATLRGLDRLDLLSARAARVLAVDLDAVQLVEGARARRRSWPSWSAARSRSACLPSSPP